MDRRTSLLERTNTTTFSTPDLEVNPLKPGRWIQEESILPASDTRIHPHLEIMYDPAGQYPTVGSYPLPPAYPPTNNYCCHSSLQNQQSSMVVINSEPHLIQQPIPTPRSYYRHIVVACIVFWLCGVLFGLLAFVYAGELIICVPKYRCDNDHYSNTFHFN